MLGIAIGHRIARFGRLGPEGRPTVTATDLAGTDGVADPATALTTLLAEVTGEEAVATGEEAVLGLPASAGREAEADLRRAAKDAGLRVNRIVPEPVAVALHYGAIDEGVHRTVLVVDQAATTVDLTVLAITPDLTVRIVTTRTEQLADDHALTAIAQELTEAAPDAVLLSGDLYTTPAHRTDIENLADVQGLTMRCRAPELAVVHGLLLLEDFGLLRIATGPAPARAHFPPPLEDPEPQPWPTPAVDPEPQNAPPDNALKGRGAMTAPPRGREQPPPPDSEPLTATGPNGRGAVTAPPRGPERPPPPHSEPPTATTPPIPTPEPEPEPELELETPRREPAPTLRSVPVTQLEAIRRDDHLLVLWAWPDSALTARVRWRREDVTTAGDGPRDGDIRCQRRVYEHDGGLDLPVGRGAVTLTVEALVPDPAVDTEGAASLRIPAEPPIVEYEPSLRRRLTGARVATVTFTARTGCDLPALRIVHGLGRYRPTSTAEGTVLHEVPAQRLPAGAPLIVEFPLPSTKGPSWLVCFPVDGPDSGPDSGQDHDIDIDIRPTALHRLRVT
ncbi:Fibronectin type III domain protein [Streptomyces bingchenggensis BCW-1]|uniref:Fibronectin type III domain protein n=2 Tax=Streptomyces TaxID=1883 RepID=D7C0G0_STRBB|nr:MULTISPECIES: Hsp70 family protein [Streptomyces]ADI03651.1 Fibronectin type III domain protein [Streptomyces bingchenggensis BCW-1]